MLIKTSHTMYSLKANEETIKNLIRQDFFADYDGTQCFDNIDFSVAVRHEGLVPNEEKEYLLWAEAKAGNKHKLFDSLVQLILTIGKARTIESVLPPKFLGAFDAEKIAFIPYSSVMQVFSLNDFNWNVAPSDHSTKEFKMLYQLVSDQIKQHAAQDGEIYIYQFAEDAQELHRFIKRNFVSGRDKIQRIRVNHNNFVAIFQKWRKEVMPTINVNWENAKQHNLLDSYFYLADLIAENNRTLLDNLHVLLQDTHYELDRHIDTDGLFTSKQVQFRDKMVAHTRFWTHYARPPKREYWDKIVERQDLLVPQDVRERKGSYFTPAIWVEKSQEYLADVFGENWQDEYYIWDCCAGTGNLLANLTNKYRIWASTLDMADVKVMWERIEMMGEGSNLLRQHVFQFDFLNDSFDDPKLPQSLRDVLQDEEKRKHLIIYINPPYAEATSATTVTGTGSNKAGVANQNATYLKYKHLIGKAANELFAQFFIRVYLEIPSSALAEFSTLKILQAPNFADFREVFRAKLEKLFLVPADTFDNVKGQFPIGFFVWNSNEQAEFNKILADVYDRKGEIRSPKLITVPINVQSMNKWVKRFDNKDVHCIGLLDTAPPDFQNSKFVNIALDMGARNARNPLNISQQNLITASVYLSVRQCIEATWLNDRDQFLYPNEGWKADRVFQLDCLAYTLFHGQNRISATQGINHWIPFTEQELNAPDNFQSHFMSDFLRDFRAGKIRVEDMTASSSNPQREIAWEAEPTLTHTAGGAGERDATQAVCSKLSAGETPASPVQMDFSAEAQEVMEAGRAIWHYYLHHHDGELYATPLDVNASFYDIRRYFQGANDKGKMNNDSPDTTYMQLLRDLRTKQKRLAAKIAEKVYAYEFLK